MAMRRDAIAAHSRALLTRWAFVLGALGQLESAAHAQSSEFVVSTAQSGDVVVERSAADGSRREGFVLDREGLVQTLQARVLEQQGLGSLARVTTASASSKRGSYAKLDRGSSFASAYTFRHRFAQPFAALEARLDLAPLDDEGAFGFLYRLTLLLGLAVVIGLYAVYRMVAVQLRFAERRNNFVAAVSHELKTPLTAIRMYGEMLRDDLVENDDKRREYYATITSETERLSRLINNVLELSRLERRERPIEMRVGDVIAVCHEVAAVFRPHAELEGFRIEVQAQSGLPAARFDRDALTQVLFNLLDNALKYGRGAGERVISVRCERAEQGVRLIVADLGPGVPAEQLELIFEPFYRAQNELTRTQKGTGIGLALVRGLVGRMQGSVEGRNVASGFEVHVKLLGG